MRSPHIVLCVVALLAAPGQAVLGDPSSDYEFVSIAAITVDVLGKMQTVCTCSSIDEKNRYWLTAAHCVGTRLLYVRGVLAAAVMVNVEDDIAVLQSHGTGARALELSDDAPRYKDVIEYRGYPRGVPLIFLGHIANPLVSFTLGPPPIIRMMINIPSAPGASGGPLLNRRGEIVSIMQIIDPHEPPTAFGLLAGGIGWASLRKYSGYFSSERGR